ncbi:MAG: glycosyltransferase family 2 protein [bacterium]|nr:glycosyltransferase family 2 protein [bacterium]
MSVSVIIITHNEEKNILACLESVKWADEIVVVDAFSLDNTKKLAEGFGAKVFQREWPGYGRQKNYALSKASMDWILSLDADERITPELAEEIQEMIQNPAIDGYQICRKAYFLGKWIRHSGWYPDYCLRLFRKGKAVFAEKPVHEYVELDGRMGRLKGAMLHYTDNDLNHYLAKLQSYTTLAADELVARGKKASIVDLITRPMFIFLKMYILKKGFLDGMHGFILAILSSFYVFVKYAKVWEGDIGE